MKVTTSSQSKADYILLAYFVILLLFGLLMLTSAGAIGGYFKQQTFYFVQRQVLFGVLPGLIAFIFFAKLPYVYLKRYSIILFLGSIILLALVFMPYVGSSHNTFARSWIIIAGHSFQPAEFAKLGTVIFLAAFLSNKESYIRRLPGFLVTLGLGLVPAFLVVAQPDIGSSIILCITVFGMLFVAGAKLSYMSGLASVGAMGFTAMAFLVERVHERVRTFVDLWTGDSLDVAGAGFQVYHAILAVGSGGFWGQGYGHSRQKFGYLPEVHADSIFAIVAEEMGFLFAAGLILLLILITIRAIRLAKAAPDQFSRYLISGIIIWFMVQSFINIGTVIGIFPLTGVPLPFVSHGGTALMTAMAAVGILINISRYATYQSK